MSDPFNLSRFTAAQESLYSMVLDELRNGEKQSHWMWFIFPQLKGLGYSSMAAYYGIGSKAEAQAYLAHEVLGIRLLECCRLIASHTNKTAWQIFGTPDALKFHSCLTLFATVAEEGSIFHQLLAAFFQGRKDERTLQLLMHGS